MIRRVLKKIIGLLVPVLYWKMKASSQNDNKESFALLRYAEELRVDRSFIEFGFSPYEYNSVDLTKQKYKGFLLDGDKLNCDLANRIFRRLKLDVTARCHWITLESLDPLIDFVRENDGKLGVLNVDIDGNDYWILKELLLHFKPQIICVEHNASFGLRSVTVPYLADFERHKMHNSGWYHGASITAFSKLLKEEYTLIENIEGQNLIFVRRDVSSDRYSSVNAEEAYSECTLRNKWSGTAANEQWITIKDLEFIEV